MNSESGPGITRTLKCLSRRCEILWSLINKSAVSHTETLIYPPPPPTHPPRSHRNRFRRKMPESWVVFWKICDCSCGISHYLKMKNINIKITKLLINYELNYESFSKRSLKDKFKYIRSNTEIKQIRNVKKKWKYTKQTSIVYSRTEIFIKRSHTVLNQAIFAPC